MFVSGLLIADNESMLVMSDFLSCMFGKMILLFVVCRSARCSFLVRLLCARIP